MTRPSLRETERWVAEALETDRLERGLAERLGASLRDPRILGCLVEGAGESKRRSRGDRVTVSRNVFVPLTNLCRNRCTYCTFAKLPDSPEARTVALGEVRELARRAVRAGCTEALFCLGDKPEVAYPAYRRWLDEAGYAATADYLLDACRVAFEQGVLPHTNAGLLTAEQMEALRPWNASMGLMLESTSPRLREKGMAHFWAPDKEPEARIRMHREAGELAIAFTSGMLLGIGETDEERVDTLLTIRSLDDRYQHVQEVIVQPFHPKPDTRMRGVPSPSDDEVVGWVALARLCLGSAMNLQAPPNLAPSMLEKLVRAGVNDWGGVSPLTIDFINPEAPWPALDELRRRTEAAGARLVERLPIYPELLIGRPDLLDPSVREAATRRADADGAARPHPSGTREEAA